MNKHALLSAIMFCMLYQNANAQETIHVITHNREGEEKFNKRIRYNE